MELKPAKINWVYFPENASMLYGVINNIKAFSILPLSNRYYLYTLGESNLPVYSKTFDSLDEAKEMATKLIQEVIYQILPLLDKEDL